MSAASLERVAARLAVDDDYRKRCRQGLQDAVGGGTGGSGGVDVLGRVRRLNEYLATGLLLGEDEGSSGISTAPLPWKLQQPLDQQQVTAATAVPPPPQAAGRAGASNTDSESDSDLEDGEAPEGLGGAGGAGLASLLAATQAAVERRRRQAALTIQCAFRRHRAQQLLQQLRRQRQAIDRLAARIIGGAYRRVCGAQRHVGRRQLVARMRMWRRWSWRVRLRQLRQQQRQDRHVARETQQGPAEAGQPWVGGEEARQHQAPQQQQAAEQDHQHMPAVPPAPPGMHPVQTEPHTVPSNSRSSSGGGAGGHGGCSGPSLAEPAPEPAQPAMPSVQPASAHSVTTAVPQPAFMAPVRLPNPAACPVPALPCTASSRGGSPAQQVPALEAGCLQQCLAPPQHRRPSSSHSQQVQGEGTPRATTPASLGGWGSPRSAGSAGRHSSTPPETAARSGSGGDRTYRRLSSIQLLESLQLGIDGTAGSVASQAALDVCERVQERVAGLQRAASSSSSSSKRTISRVGSKAQWQASRGTTPP